MLVLFLLEVEAGHRLGFPSHIFFFFLGLCVAQVSHMACSILADSRCWML